LGIIERRYFIGIGRRGRRPISTIRVPHRDNNNHSDIDDSTWRGEGAEEEDDTSRW
jgi:hypothetical protein